MSVATLPTTLTPGSYVIESSHSEANFIVRHVGIAKVRGTFTGLTGTLEIAENLADSTVTATIDPSTVTTRDDARDAHLRSADFFEVETFPTWTFVSTGISADGDDYAITGDLTIHGVTRSVELDTEFNGTAVDPYGNFRAGFSASTEISRKDYGLTWNVALEAGGVMVSDKVKIILEVEAVKQV